MISQVNKQISPDRSKEGSNFCYYPFMQILVTSDGKYRPCSKHQDYITHNGKVLHSSEATFEDAWNSDYMHRIRQDFLDGRQFKGCSECWRLQKMGLKSMRYDSYQYGITEAQVQHPVKPVRIEINASNVCNLRCRICYPNASSKWIKESKDLYGQQEMVYKNLEGLNLEQVKGWADTLEEVCFFGGEPLLSEDNLDLLDYFISSGYSGKIALLFNTNGTIFSPEIADRLIKFRRVRMYFSIDDIGDRFEYQRSGARWSEVEENIRKAYALSRSEAGRNIDFKICSTVSILNIYYYPEFFAYFSREFPGLKIFWNLIFDPWRLSIQILPPSVKAVLRDRLENYIHTTYRMTEDETKTVDELVRYLEYKVEKPFDEFFRFINRHDVYRRESFSEVFAEFWQLLLPYKPADLEMGKYDAADTIRNKMLKDPDNFPHLSAILRYQNEKMPLHRLMAHEGRDKVIENCLAAMVEIAEQYGNGPHFREKIADMPDILQKESFGNDFIGEFLLTGPFKVYEALNDLESGEVSKRIFRKYSLEHTAEI